jgi:hypothetical protein
MIPRYVRPELGYLGGASKANQAFRRNLLSTTRSGQNDDHGNLSIAHSIFDF